jgi:hypothetical protein
MLDRQVTLSGYQLGIQIGEHVTGNEFFQRTNIHQKHLIKFFCKHNHHEYRMDQIDDDKDIKSNQEV